MITSDSDLWCDLYPKAVTLPLDENLHLTLNSVLMSEIGGNVIDCWWKHISCDKTLTITTLKFSLCLVLSLIAVSWFFFKINLGSERFLLIEIWERCFQIGVLFIHFNLNVSNKDWFLSVSSQLYLMVPVYVCVHRFAFLSLTFVPTCYKIKVI